MIIAVDKGTTYTKTSDMFSIKSVIREYKPTEINFSQDKTIVEYKNNDYVIGEDGKTNTNLFKSQQEETKLLVLTAIALSNPLEIRKKVHLMTGLPIGRLGYEGDNMKNLFQNTSNKINVNGLNYIIDIDKVEVFPEGASSFYYLQNINEGLIVDIGGLSIDIALFKKGGKLQKYSTYRLGVMPLYRKIANYIGSKYSLTLNEWNVQDVIEEGLSIDGVSIELNTNDIIYNYIQEIIQALEFDYNIPSIKNIILTGGGSEFLYPYMKNIINRIKIMSNPKYSNVLSYKLLGEVLFS